MNLPDETPTGVYIDEVTGDIWRKPNPVDHWTVNGKVWTPFPDTLTPLYKLTTLPVVSIADSVYDEAIREEWRTIPKFPNYESNQTGDVREKDTKERLSLCCNDPQHAYYWLKDTLHKGDWVSRSSVTQK